MTAHHCYVLRNDRDGRTYVGYTVDPARRLRQHNGEIAGGARFTTRRAAKQPATPTSSDGGGFWRFLAIVRSDDPAFDKHKALSLEWWLKHPDGRRRTAREFCCSPDGRVKGLRAVLAANPKFAGIDFQVCVGDEQCGAYVQSRAWAQGPAADAREGE